MPGERTGSVPGTRGADKHPAENHLEIPFGDKRPSDQVRGDPAEMDGEHDTAEQAKSEKLATAATGNTHGSCSGRKEGFQAAPVRSRVD